MGVKNLTKLLQRYASNSIKPKTINDYQNKTLVLDGSIFLRKFVYGFRSTIENEILHPHIQGFYKLTIFLKQNGIRPIFIFDSRKRIKEKRKEIARRKAKAEILLQNWKFEKNRKSRAGEWKNIVERLDNLEETKYQYATSGIKAVTKEVLSSIPSPTVPIPANEITPPPREEIIKPVSAFPPVIETTQDIVQSLLQGMIVLVMYAEKALTLERITPKIAKDLKEDITKIKDFEKKGDENLKEVAKEEKIEETAPLIYKSMMKTITNLKDEKKFKETHPDFEPLADDVKLKEDTEQIIKETLQDTAKLLTDKGFTKAQREVGLMENLLMGSVISRNKSLEILEKFEAESHNIAVTYEQRVIPVTSEMYLESIDFIRTLGIPCITLDEHEAEAMCASIVTFGLADATISEDMDTTIFGDGILLRQFFQKNKPILEISPVEARKSLELSHDQYIDLCILCGTDFAGTIRHIGPVTALKLIKKYGSIESILPHLKPERHLVSPDYIVEVQAARKLYKNPPEITTHIRNQLECDTENIDEFNRLLEKFKIDLTINESLDYNVFVYDVNSAENVNGDYLGPDPFSSKTSEL
jgi:5'-3' exonuclease